MLTDKELKNFEDQMPEGVKIVDMRTLGTKLYSWDFVMKFHPNYTGSENVTKAHDLHLIISGEHHTKLSASQLYKELEMENAECGGWGFDQYVKERLAIVNSRIYEEAIEGFIEYMKGGKNG